MKHSVSLLAGRSARFRLWDTAGHVAWYIGSGVIVMGPVNRFGLWLCGLSGSLHGKADSYR